MNEFKKNLKASVADETIYVCGICGKPYSNIKERMECESKCYEERKKAEEALKKQKLAKERDARKAEIEEKSKELSELIRDFIKDYGYLQLHSNVGLDKSIFDFDKMFGEWF